MRDEIREAVIELVERARADHENEMDEVCIGWVTVSRDEENGNLYITGVFDTPEEAAADAVAIGQQLNTDDVEEGEGWEITVHRLMPKKEDEKC